MAKKLRSMPVHYPDRALTLPQRTMTMVMPEGAGARRPKAEGHLFPRHRRGVRVICSVRRPPDSLFLPDWCQARSRLKALTSEMGRCSSSCKTEAGEKGQPCSLSSTLWSLKFARLRIYTCHTHGPREAEARSLLRQSIPEAEWNNEEVCKDQPERRSKHIRSSIHAGITDDLAHKVATEIGLPPNCMP